MYIIDGIAYAGEQKQPVKVVGIKVMPEYKLWVRFNTGESRLFDFFSLLNDPCYTALKDKKLFSDVYIDYGVPSWDNGNIDISPEYIYNNSIPYEMAV